MYVHTIVDVVLSLFGVVFFRNVRFFFFFFCIFFFFLSIALCCACVVMCLNDFYFCFTTCIGSFAEFCSIQGSWHRQASAHARTVKSKRCHCTILLFTLRLKNKTKNSAKNPVALFRFSFSTHPFCIVFRFDCSDFPVMCAFIFRSCYLQFFCIVVEATRVSPIDSLLASWHTLFFFFFFFFFFFVPFVCMCSLHFC
jgi:hypothetical protein